MTLSNEDRLDGVIREKFREGMSRVYGSRIWRFLLKELRNGHVQTQLARAAGTDQGSISADRTSGVLTFPKLVALAVGLEFELLELPKKPPLEALADGGFAYCLTLIRQRIQPESVDRELDAIDFELLRNIRQNRDWYRAKGPANLARRMEIVECLHSRLSEDARQRLQELGPGAVRHVEHLESIWSDAWRECVDTVRSTYKWTLRIGERSEQTRNRAS